MRVFFLYSLHALSRDNAADHALGRRPCPGQHCGTAPYSGVLARCLGSWQMKSLQTCSAPCSPGPASSGWRAKNQQNTQHHDARSERGRAAFPPLRVQRPSPPWAPAARDLLCDALCALRNTPPSPPAGQCPVALSAQKTKNKTNPPSSCNLNGVRKIFFQCAKDDKDHSSNCKPTSRYACTVIAVAERERILGIVPESPT